MRHIIEGSPVTFKPTKQKFYYGGLTSHHDAHMIYHCIPNDPFPKWLFVNRSQISILREEKEDKLAGLAELEDAPF